MNILLIWQLVPERLLVYKLAVSFEDGRKLKLCNGKLINVDLDDELIEWLIGFEENIHKDCLIFDSNTPTQAVVLDYNSLLIVTGFAL